MKLVRQWRTRAGFLVTAILFAGFIAAPSVLAATITGITGSSSTTPVYISQFGSSGTGDG